jgi:hypothetical protein
MRVTDRDVVACARRSAGTDPARLDAFARAALAVGARALAAAGADAEIASAGRRLDELADQVARATDASAARLQQAVDRAADDRTGTLAVSVRTALAALTADVGALVAGEDAPLRAAVARSVRQATDDAAGRVERALADNTAQVRDALSPTNPAGPFAAMRQEVLRAAEQTRREVAAELAELRTVLAVARERSDMMQRTAVKDATYEAQVVAAVTDVAHGAGDTVDGTGSEVGLVPNAKTGDAVVTVGGHASRGLGVKVVVEAKDAGLSSERWRRELEAGRRNRSAAGGLGVVRDADRMPGGRRRVHVIDTCNIVVAWDPDTDPPDMLTAAYLLVRAGAVQAANAGTGDDTDRAALAEAVRDAYDALTGFDALDRAAGSARRSLDEIAKTADGLRAVLHGHLGRGLRLLGGKA